MGIFSLDCVEPKSGQTITGSRILMPRFLVGSLAEAVDETRSHSHNQQSLGDSDSKLVLIGIVLTVLACAATALGMYHIATHGSCFHFLSRNCPTEEGS